MKKRFVSILLVAAMVTSLAACGSTDGSKDNNGNSGSSAASTETGKSGSSDGSEITLTIPTYYVGENVGAVYFEPAVERFNEANAGKYHIELEEVVEASYTDKISQLAQSNSLPALIQTPSVEWVKTAMIPGKLYYPMNDFLDAHPEIKELCVDASLEFCTQENGDIVSLPAITLSNVGLFYNSALYSPDKSISSMSVDEFVDSLGDNKIAFQTVDNAWTSALLLTALIANEEGGADLLRSYEGSKCLDYNQPQFVDAVTKLKEIWDTNAASNSVGAAYADAANAFMSDQAAVIANGSWMNSEFGEDASGNWSNDFNGADVKADYYPGNVAICDTAVYGRWTITNGGTDKEREVAEAFLAFLFSKEELETFALTEGCQIPNLTYSDEFLAALNEKPLVKQQTELLTADTNIVPNVLNIMPDSVMNSVFGTNLVQLVNGQITPEDFCDILTTKSAEASEE